MSVCMLVNGDRNSSMGRRARGLTQYLSYPINILYRENGRLRSMIRFLRAVRETKPSILYVMKIGWAGFLAAVFAKILWSCKFIIDTGDLVYELDKHLGNRSFFGLCLIWLMEKVVLRVANKIVVRGTFHKELLKKRGLSNVFYIPDGVDTGIFKPFDVSEWRSKLGLDGKLTIGTIGATIWRKREQTSFGWEIIEVVNILKEFPVVGIIIGNGNGLPYLKQQAKEYNIDNRIIFLSDIPYKDIPKCINLVDICTSALVNTPVGMVRTTGKLPEYLACGKYMLLTDVGEARLVLPGEMLVPYEGYALHIAERIKEILKDTSILSRGESGIAIAKNKFEYRILCQKMRKVIEGQVTA